MKIRITAAAAALLFSLVLPAASLFAAEKAVLQDHAAATQTVSFDIFLPLEHRDQLGKLLADLHDSASPSYQHWLTPAEFVARFGASDARVSPVLSQLHTSGLTATRVSAHRIHVTGSASDVERTFGTTLQNATFANGHATIVATQPLIQSDALLQANAVVTGLSGMIRMRAHAHKSVLPENRYSTTGGYWFDDLKQAYSYPSFQSLNGRGTTIGILMSGAYNPPDMDKYFGHEKLETPHFSQVDIDGGSAFDPNGSFETHLDLQQSGGMAPKASIILYNLPDLSDTHVMDGLSKIITDNKADVVSMSFGGAEVFYTPEYNDGVDVTSVLEEEDDLFAQGNAQGITFIASSGDSGALGAVPLVCFNGGPNCGSFLPSVEFPASSPHVTGVGGTNLVTTYTGVAGNLNSEYVRESAFADPLAVDIFFGTSATGGYWGSGGGYSILFSKPLFQEFVKTDSHKFRTVPDLSLHMGGCPGGTISCGADDSFDYEVIGNQYVGVIGTSASAPDFAGLAALTVQRFGQRLGNANYYIYTLAAAQDFKFGLKVFRTGIPGYNGLFKTTPKGYNMVLGVGTIIGKNFLLAPSLPAAGVPQTPSNP